jgi:hypothetical protein
MSTVPTEASVGASTATTWGLNTAPTETSSFFSKSDDGQSSDLTSGNRDAASTVVGHPELEARKRGGRGGSGGKGGKGGKGGNSGQISLSTTQLGGRWTGNFYPKHTTLPVGLGTDVHEEDGGPGGEDPDIYDALESIIADAEEQLGTVSDEKNKYQDFKNMLDRLLKEAEDPKNWADVAMKYNEYVAKLNDEINAVTSGVAASDTINLPFSKIALAAVGTAAMYGLSCRKSCIFHFRSSSLLYQLLTACSTSKKISSSHHLQYITHVAFGSRLYSPGVHNNHIIVRVVSVRSLYSYKVFRFCKTLSTQNDS